MLSAADQALPEPASPEPASPEATPVLRRKIAAILAADVAGYSRLVAEDEERTLHDLAAAREVFDARVRRGGGRIFNTAGDSVMCEFDSAVEAVRAAVDIQRALGEREAAPGRRLAFRMGLTIGDVVERDGDLLGDGVNVAARLEGLAEPGAVCVSRSVHEAVANKVPVVFRDLGERRVKNIPRPVHAFMIPAPPVASGPAPSGPLRAERLVSAPAAEPSASPRTGGRRVAVAAAVLALAVAGSAAVAVRHGLRPASPEHETTITSTERANMAPPAGADRPADGARPGNERADTARPDAKADAAAAEATKAEPSRTDPSRSETSRGEPAKPDTGRAEQARADVKPIPRPERPASAAEASAQFAAASRLGRLPDAVSVPELYHNARWLETHGERPAALRLYAALAVPANDFIDVELRYAALLRALSGPAAARSTFAELTRNAPSRALSLAHILQADGEERRGRLEAFVAANPDGGTADFLLAEEYMGRTGGPTLTERRLAFDAYDRFLEAVAAGSVAPSFLDGTLLSAWTETARRRRGEIEGVFAGQPSRPTVSVSRAETGWLARITLPEPALSVSMRTGERGEFVPTGLLGTADPRTGKPAPNLVVPVPPLSGRTTLYLTYLDRSGREAGPFAQPFDPRAALVASERETLEKYPDSWVSFRPDVPDVLSVAQLVSNRCAIASALIGYGDAAPDRPLALPDCDERAPTAIPADFRGAIALPAGTDTVRVKLAYADGTESATRTFRRP